MRGGGERILTERGEAHPKYKEGPRLQSKQKKNNNNKKKNKNKKTDPRNKGLISEDRGNTPTLPLTIPRSLHRSSAKDPAPPRRLKLPSGSLGSRA